MTSKTIRLNNYESATIHNSLIETIKNYEILFKQINENKQLQTDLEPYMEWYKIEYETAKKLLNKI